MIVTGVDERHTERTQTTVLGITLLEIAHSTNELLAGDFFVVRKEVALSRLPGVVDKDVGICSHTSNGTDHVATPEGVSISATTFYFQPPSTQERGILVQNIKLLRRCVLFQ